MLCEPENIVVIGSSGAIGHAFIEKFLRLDTTKHITALSRCETDFNDPRVETDPLEIEDEKSIARAAQRIQKTGPIHAVVIATGMLHSQDIQPEKALKDLSAQKFAKLFAVNTIGPALIAKHFLPLMDKQTPSLFAALSARVGSISDNIYGGWYAYRASKAALNMLIKNISIEAARTLKLCTIVGIHPGTVNSALSTPFQSRVPEGKLFTPQYAVEQMWQTLSHLTPSESGKLFAYDGEEIAP